MILGLTCCAQTYIDVWKQEIVNSMFRNNLNIIQKKRLLNLMSLIKQIFKKTFTLCYKYNEDVKTDHIHLKLFFLQIF